MKYLVAYVIFYRSGSFTFANSLEETDELTIEDIRWFERRMLNSDSSFSNVVVVNIVSIGG